MKKVAEAIRPPEILVTIYTIDGVKVIVANTKIFSDLQLVVLKGLEDDESLC